MSLDHGASCLVSGFNGEGEEEHQEVEGRTLGPTCFMFIQVMLFRKCGLTGLTDNSSRCVQMAQIAFERRETCFRHLDISIQEG